MSLGTASSKRFDDVGQLLHSKRTSFAEEEEEERFFLVCSDSSILITVTTIFLSSSTISQSEVETSHNSAAT